MSDGEFKSSFRGYDRAEVDARIKADGDKLSALRAELTMLKSQYEAIKADENAIKETMILANKAKEDAIEQARAEAAKIIQDAKQRADEIAKESKAQIESLRWDLEKLHLDKQRFIDTYRRLLEENLRELAEGNKGLPHTNSQPAAPEAATVPSPEPEA